jgi:hypothetical protein
MQEFRDATAGLLVLFGDRDRCRLWRQGGAATGRGERVIFSKMACD